MKVTFCGAARMVTGSCYLLQVDGKQYLIDCGMFQGSKEITRLNYKPFLFEPADISAVFLTHSHIDHSGLLPKLVRGGFKGKIYSTSASADLCRIMLEDSAHVQEMEAMHENRRRQRAGLETRKVLYNQKDVIQTNKRFRPVSYDAMFKVDENITIRFIEAGHILGSSSIEVYATENEITQKLVFSGDVGQWDAPIVKDPNPADSADYVFIESTYGDRLHEGSALREEKLMEYIWHTYKKGGKLLIPSFAVERTQELLYSLKKLFLEDKIPKDMKVFLDSPLAIKATEVFKQHREVYDKETLALSKNPFSFPQLKYLLTAEDSMTLNTINKPCIVIAGSGMCNAGRIRHHLKHGLWDQKNTVLIVGYQANGTLGRFLVDGFKKVRMMGTEVRVGAEVFTIDSFSAHGDYRDLVRWLTTLKEKPDTVFIMHGEEKSSLALEKKFYVKGFKSYIPKIGETINLL